MRNNHKNVTPDGDVFRVCDVIRASGVFNNLKDLISAVKALTDVSSDVDGVGDAAKMVG